MADVSTEKRRGDKRLLIVVTTWNAQNEYVYISQFHMHTDECARPRNSQYIHTHTNLYHNNEIKYLYPTDNVMS